MAIMPANGAITPDAADSEVLAQLEAVLGRETSEIPRLIGPRGEEVILPASVYRALRQLVHMLAQQQSVAVVSVERELTTQEAADLLNVSRPYLVRLLEGGEIPFMRTGAHRRVRLGDVLAYKRRRDTARGDALDRLAQLNQELGLYDE
jgi:excisionase family DNA binding protein